MLAQFKADQWADGQKLLRRDPLSVVCSVTETLLFGVKPFAGSAESNQFYVASYSLPPAFITGIVPITWRGTVVPPGGRFFNHPAFNFEICPQEESSFFLDGDFYNNSPQKIISLKLGPELSLVSNF
jgi:hypothetical protein